MSNRLAVMIATVLVAASVLAAPSAAEEFDARSAASLHHSEDDNCLRYYSETDDCEDFSTEQVRADLKLNGKTLDVVVADYPKLELFQKLIEASGLMSELHGKGPFTIFAPTNSAFSNQTGMATRTLLKSGRQDLIREAVARHIVVGEITWQQMAGRKTELNSLAGSKLIINGENGILIQKARISTSDVLAANGVIHIVDQVISTNGKIKPSV